MEQRPRGREKNVTGPGKGIRRRGEGLNTGPVGRSDGYTGRTSSGSSGGTTRASGGRSPLAIILIIAALIFGGGGVGLSSLLGGGGSSDVSSATPASLQQLMQFGGGSVSSGWVRSANTGRLDTSVANGARAKRVATANAKNATVMVYMCGADLESKHGMATADLKEMANATLNGNLNVLVYTGGCKEWKNSAVSNRVNQIYKIENGGMRCLVKDDGSAAMTTPSTLTKFIQYCTKNYPADRYELIFWDHGGGSVSGYGYDEKNLSAGAMSLKGINDALSAAGTTFDFIGFDACLMATLENALMLNRYADYLIASEETEPGIGWYYTNWLTAFARDPSLPTTQLGKQIVDDFIDVCNQRCSGQKATLSLIDLAELSATVPARLTAFAADTSEMMQGDQFRTVSDARSNTKEFSTNKIDQIDLVHFASNLGTAEGKSLADSLLGAVKYNRTASCVTNAYGISIYFPYRKTGKVDSAVATYNAIGMDSSYSRCIQQFASMEVSGQAAAGGSSLPFPSLFGSSSASSGASSVGGITDILSGLLGGNFSGLGDLSSGNTNFLSSFLDVNRTAEYVAEHRFDASQLVWTRSDGSYRMTLSEDQWAMVHDLQLNVFFDDGQGYLDLGLDNVFAFDENGALAGEYDGTWLAIDDQPVAYYYVDSIYNGDDYVITGRVPVLLNGSRAELLLVFDNANPKGYIAGARAVYAGGETETEAKSVSELTAGDQIEFICDYYSYAGVYQNTYRIGDPLTYRGNHRISNVEIDKNAAKASYLFTDIYCQEYWTPEIPR